MRGVPEARVPADRGLLLLHEKRVYLVRLGVRQQVISGLLGKDLEVLDRTRVRGKHAQHLSALEFGESLLGAENRKWTVEASHVEIPIESCHRQRFAVQTK